MHHLAIMRREWGLTAKIASGSKKIESRWYVHKVSPWGKIAAGDTVFFKDSGRAVNLIAQVEKVLQYSDLTPGKVRAILVEYGKDDGIDESDIEKFYGLFKNRRYCLLIFLRNPQAIEPFEISKKGFGAMTAWISINDINKIKLSQDC